MRRVFHPSRPLEYPTMTPHILRPLLVALFALSLLRLASAAEQGSLERQGRVTAVGVWKISLQDESGDVEQYDVDPEAKIFHNGKPAMLGAIDTGDTAKLTLKTKRGDLVVVLIDARDRE